VGKLLTILLKRDNKLVPVFCKALVATDQAHVAKILGYEGLYTFIVLETFVCIMFKLNKIKLINLLTACNLINTVYMISFLMLTINIYYIIVDIISFYYSVKVIFQVFCFKQLFVCIRVVFCIFYFVFHFIAVSSAVDFKVLCAKRSNKLLQTIYKIPYLCKILSKSNKNRHCRSADRQKDANDFIVCPMLCSSSRTDNKFRSTIHNAMMIDDDDDDDS